ncbi:MAG: hypothetical protein GY757_18775 [bacterium]|nr:hypothetical protein [bacterium]
MQFTTGQMLTAIVACMGAIVAITSWVRSASRKPIDEGLKQAIKNAEKALSDVKIDIRDCKKIAQECLDLARGTNRDVEKMYEMHNQKDPDGKYRWHESPGQKETLKELGTQLEGVAKIQETVVQMLTGLTSQHKLTMEQQLEMTKIMSKLTDRVDLACEKEIKEWKK